MQPAEVFEKLKSAAIEGVLEFVDGPKDQSILVEPQSLPAILEFLKTDDALQFDQLSILSGVHYDDRFECVYHILSTVLHHDVIVRVNLDGSNPTVPTASTVYTTADWHERETFDLVGINFEGHPDLRRIYLPEGWVGHPLRRDYEFPEEFQGIPLTDKKRAEWEPLPREAKPPAATETAATDDAEKDDKITEQSVSENGDDDSQ